MKSYFLWVAMVLVNTACASASTNAIEGISSHVSKAKTFKRDKGNIVYEDSDTAGPVVMMIPGMGESRGSFRFLAPLLVSIGFRVITIDPRGEGDSDAAFSSYAASAVGSDISKLVDHVGKDVYLVGNSSGGASAAWVAATRPNKVKGIVLLDAFLRDHPMSIFNKILLKVALNGPWAASSWVSYYRGLFISKTPEDQERYAESLKQSLKRDGHVSALRSMVFTSKDDIELKLHEVHTDVLAMSGSKDPDFENGAEDELNWIHSKLGGEKRLIEGAGHYPHLEYPEQVAKLIAEFVTAHSL